VSNPQNHSRLMWVLVDVVGLFSSIVGSFSRNVGRSVRIFSANVGQKRRMLSGPAVYVLGPLQLTTEISTTFNHPISFDIALCA
jgi:hypothetical protein